MKTFKDLVFEPHAIAKAAKPMKGYPYEEYKDARHATMYFDNGYGISVILGRMFYSNGVDTYEVGILKEGEMCYDTPITPDGVIRYVSTDGVSRIMAVIQEL